MLMAKIYFCEKNKLLGVLWALPSSSPNLPCAPPPPPPPQEQIPKGSYKNKSELEIFFTAVRMRYIASSEPSALF